MLFYFSINRKKGLECARVKPKIYELILNLFLKVEVSEGEASPLFLFGGLFLEGGDLALQQRHLAA